MKLSELTKAIYLKQYPDNENDIMFEDLTKSIKARIDEFQKIFKEYNKELAANIGDNDHRATFDKLANEGLKAIDDSRLDAVAELLKPLIGNGKTLKKRFSDMTTPGIYDSVMSEVLIALQNMAVNVYIDTTDVPDGFGEEAFIDSLVSRIEKLIWELDNMATALNEMSPNNKIEIAQSNDNRMILERINVLELDVNALRASLA